MVSVTVSVSERQEVCVSSNSGSRWVAVTDTKKNTVTLLDVNNGAVITSRQLQNGRYGPLGVSVDSADDIFVCATPNIVVLSGELKNEHVLCNLGDKGLLASAYDDKKHQLNLSLVVRKPVFGVSDQVRHKPGCTATEDGYPDSMTTLAKRWHSIAPLAYGYPLGVLCWPNVGPTMP